MGNYNLIFQRFIAMQQYRNGPPISFRPQGQQQNQQGFNRNQFVSPQFQQQNFQQFHVQPGFNQNQFQGGGNMIPMPQQQPQTLQKSYMNDPRAGSNMDAKYVAHLGTLENFINQNDVKKLPGSVLVNKTKDNMDFELC